MASSSPRFTPARYGTPRDDLRAAHSRPSSEQSAYNDSEDGMAESNAAGGSNSGPSRDAYVKLDQIVHNFFTKSAVVILQGRVSLPIIPLRNGSPKVNKWFQLETQDTEAFQDELRLWKTCSAYENRPPAMIIETYLDTSKLTSNQTLVIVDDNGKRWDVAEALHTSTESNEVSQRRPRTEVVLERWRIELKGPPGDETYDFGPILPQVYKKCIVVFRSLYATTKFLPSWNFAKKMHKSTKTNLRMSCRIIAGDEFQFSTRDPLSHPLYDSHGPVTTDFSVGETDSPGGRLTAHVSYRNDCNFRVDDSEALLSSRFMGADENYFEPSLGVRNEDLRRTSEDYFQPSLGVRSDDRRQAARTAEVGSLPSQRQRLEDAEPIQAYGSMSTFHGNAPPLGSSPISALRNARMSSDTSSPPTRPARPPPTQTDSSSARTLGAINVARRSSLSFNPFKAGSLASSPIPGTPLSGEMPPSQSPHSLSRNSGISALHQARNRSSLTAGMPASLRGNPMASENVVTSASSSPKPAPISRYSSSFGHRRSKPSYGGASKVDDGQGSSGNQSLSSSAQPGSGVLTETGAGGSSGSLQTDDDQISDFLKLLEKNKNRTLQSKDSAAHTSAQLSKFRSMQESNTVLTESMSSSAMLQRSSSNSSRQLSSIPAMVAATSMSTSSSPGKPISPHTPHTPAIPSRLSSNSVAEYSQPRRLNRRSHTTPQDPVEDDTGEDGVVAGTNAIDIPTSPRFYPHARRSSSVAQEHRALTVDDDNRSLSLGDNDREPPTRNSLLGIGQTSGDASNSGGGRERVLQPAPEMNESPVALARQLSQSHEPEDGPQPPRGSGPGSTNAPYRPRIGRMGGRGLTPPQAGSYSSLRDRDSGSGSNVSERPGSRYSFSRPAVEDDEPLLFDMSEIGRGQESRRSLEDVRGGISAAGSVSERGGYESSRGGDSGSSSRRGSRRGW